MVRHHGPIELDLPGRVGAAASDFVLRRRRTRGRGARAQQRGRRREDFVEGSGSGCVSGESGGGVKWRGEREEARG